MMVADSQRAVGQDDDFDIRIARSRCAPGGLRKVHRAEPLDLGTPGDQIGRYQRLARVGGYPQFVALRAADLLIFVVIEAELVPIAVALGLHRHLGHLGEAGRRREVEDFRHGRGGS